LPYRRRTDLDGLSERCHQTNERDGAALFGAALFRQARAHLSSLVVRARGRKFSIHRQAQVGHNPARERRPRPKRVSIARRQATGRSGKSLAPVSPLSKRPGNCPKLAASGTKAQCCCMHRELALSGFLLTREDWELLDEDTRELFTQMLAEEGRAPRFTDRPAQSARPTSLNLLATCARLAATVCLSCATAARHSSTVWV